MGRDRQSERCYRGEKAEVPTQFGAQWCRQTDRARDATEERRPRCPLSLVCNGADKQTEREMLQRREGRGAHSVWCAMVQANRQSERCYSGEKAEVPIQFGAQWCRQTDRARDATAERRPRCPLSLVRNGAGKQTEREMLQRREGRGAHSVWCAMVQTDRQSEICYSGEKAEVPTQFGVQWCRQTDRARDATAERRPRCPLSLVCNGADRQTEREMLQRREGRGAHSVWCAMVQTDRQSEICYSGEKAEVPTQFGVQWCRQTDRARYATAERRPRCPLSLVCNGADRQTERDVLQRREGLWPRCPLRFSSVRNCRWTVKRQRDMH